MKQHPLAGVAQAIARGLMTRCAADYAPSIVRAAVIGAGFGSRVHVPGLREAGIEVVAICAADREEARTAAIRSAVPSFTDDVGTLVGRTDVDLVSVASPPHLHREHVLAALRAGKHVICEKPFAKNAREAKEMLDAAIAAGTVHAVDHEFRFLRDRLALRDAIVRGELGRLQHVDIIDVSPWRADASAPTPDWWLRDEFGGGILGASGSHWIDAVRWWCASEIVAASAILRTEVAVRRAASGSAVTATADDSATLYLRTRSGVSALVHVSAVSPVPLRRAVVFGTSGIAEIDGRGLSGTLTISTAKGRRVLVHGDDRQPVPGVDAETPQYVVDAFRDLAVRIRARLEGDRAAEHPTFEDGLRVQEVIDEARRSGTKMQRGDV